MMKPSRTIQARRLGANKSEAGVAMIYALLSVIVTAGLIALSMTAGHIAQRNSQVKHYDTQAQYFAEGAVEAAKKQVQLSIANWGAVPTNGSVMVDQVQVDYSIAPTGFATVKTDATGIATIVTGYQVNAIGRMNGARSNAHRVINSLATPLFQYAVFYNSDLEVMPGANMTIRGRVHSNRNIYLNSNATLTMDTNYLHAAGAIYRNRKDDPSASTGTVLIRNWVENPFDATEPVQFTQMNSKAQMTALGVGTTSGFDSRFTTGYDANGNGVYTDSGDWLPFGPGAQAYWSQPTGYDMAGCTVQTEEHGVSEAVVPNVGSTAMYEPAVNGDYDWSEALQRYVPAPSGTGAFNPGYYHASAGLSILTYADGTWKAFTANGNDVTLAVAGAVSIHQMYDARQSNGTSAKIKVTQINIAQLVLSGHYPANGLIYAARYGEGTGLDAGGIRLVGGSTLPAGLTVATPDPLYIWGDFNTNVEKPASVICDAFNLLSKAWNDTKTQGTLPTAASTTYNVAVVTGDTETVGNSYSGGLENLPRFHENWTGKTATIKGSFVKPWFSQFATAPWVYGGDRYTAPNRNWSYNAAFNSVANLPPFTPMAVTARDIVSW